MGNARSVATSMSLPGMSSTPTAFTGAVAAVRVDAFNPKPEIPVAVLPAPRVSSKFSC